MALNPDSPLGKLMATLPQTGQVTWIGVRPARDVAMLEVDAAQVTTGIGLVGDRYKGGSGKR
ncbi:MOSC domain-containing protein, partial [Xanthomonas oryzae pv. oryzae]